MHRSIRNFNTPHGAVRQMQNADWQVDGVNIVVECSNRVPIRTLDFQNDVNCRDRDSVKAFHIKVFLVYLSVC